MLRAMIDGSNKSMSGQLLLELKLIALAGTIRTGPVKIMSWNIVLFLLRALRQCKP
jgi:hypothetical protein